MICGAVEDVFICYKMLQPWIMGYASERLEAL
jgi:hypothetical protein